MPSIVRHRWWSVALFVAPLSLAAQPSTERLRARPVEIEAGAGVDVFRSSTNRAYVVHGAVRRALDDSPIGLRLSGFFIRRNTALEYTDGEVRHNIFGVLGEADVEVTSGRDFSIGPLVGFGLAPWVSGSAHGEDVQRISARGSGTLWTLAVSVRVKRLVVRQQFLGLLGAEDVVDQFREFFPLMVEWRF